MRFLISDFSAFALFSALSAELGVVLVVVLVVVEFREAEVDEDEEEDSEEDCPSAVWPSSPWPFLCWLLLLLLFVGCTAQEVIVTCEVVGGCAWLSATKRGSFSAQRPLLPIVGGGSCHVQFKVKRNFNKKSSRCRGNSNSSSEVKEKILSSHNVIAVTICSVSAVGMFSSNACLTTSC